MFMLNTLTLHTIGITIYCEDIHRVSSTVPNSHSRPCTKGK